MKPKNSLSVITILLLLLALLLAACGGAEPEPTPRPESRPTRTQAPTAVPEAIDTPEPTPTATAVPDLTLDFVPFEDEFQGISLAHPPGWVAESFFFTILASSEELTELMMSGETPESVDGAIMLIIGGSDEDIGGDDPEAVINEAIAEFDIADGELAILSGPTVSQRDDLELVTLVAQTEAEGQELVVLYAVLLNKTVGRAAILIGITNPDRQAEYLPLMEAVVGTVAIGEAGMMDDFGGLFGSETAAGLAPFPLFLNETWPDEVTEAGPTRFSFSGAPTVRYDIVVDTQDTNLDLVLDLLDENGVSLVGGGVDETFSGAEAIRGFQPSEYGLFTIEVRGFAGGTGAFEISLLESTTPQSQLSEPGSELLATASMSPDGRVIFQFAAEEGGLVTAVVSPLEGLDVVLGIYDEADTLLLEVNEAFDEETIFFIAPADGMYQLEVRGFAGAGGSFNISLFATPNVILELFDGDELNAWLDDSGKTNYVIELAAGDTLSVTAQPEDGFDLVIELQDGNEWRLQDVDDGPRGGAETLVYTATADGFYFIHIRGFAGAANGKFTMMVTTE